jgi:DNA-binding MarR family transcriptional regulator
MNQKSNGANIDKIKEEFKNLGSVSKGEQHLIILLRMIGKSEGKMLRDYGIYKSIKFFNAIKNLERAGWIKRNYTYPNASRIAKVSFELTKKGKIFNSYLMEHPEYCDLADRIPKELIIPFGK